MRWSCVHIVTSCLYVLHSDRLAFHRWQNEAANCSRPISRSGGIASSYWAQWGVRKCHTSPLTRTAPLHSPLVSGVGWWPCLAFGHPGVWHVTSDWACQFVLKGPVVMTASEVKQEASVCNYCFKTVLKCLCISECVCFAGSGWAGRHRSMTHIHIDTCHWGLEA